MPPKARKDLRQAKHLQDATIEGGDELIKQMETRVFPLKYIQPPAIYQAKIEQGKFIRIDAEGRLILCDALAEAERDKPDLVVDFATLTGAPRVAVGTELSALFCNDDSMADALIQHGRTVGDPVWRLPLHPPYQDLLESRVADTLNSANTPFAGASTAALFLQRFVPSDIPWAHFDIMAWNPRARPGRPEGGEAMAMRAVFSHIAQGVGAA